MEKIYSWEFFKLVIRHVLTERSSMPENYMLYDICSFVETLCHGKPDIFDTCMHAGIFFF